MMTMTNHAFSITQQTLIDARLDTIDRMLMGRVPRADRLGIVREVESQIYELLSDRDFATLSRDDLLDVLRRLDPPEAYLPEEEDDEADLRRRPHVARPRSTNSHTLGGLDGYIGGASGLLSFALLFAIVLIIILLQGGNGEPGAFEFLCIAAPCCLGFASSISALIFSIRGRKQGAWPIIGFIFGTVSFPLWILGTLFLYFQLS